MAEIIRREGLLMKIPALLHLNRLGYAYLPRGSIRRDRETNIIPGTLKEAAERINGREIPEETFLRLTEDLREQLNRPDLGQAFYRTLRDGWNGLQLLDYDHPEQNMFECAAEVIFAGKTGRFRPDVTLFANGIPLAMIEVKTGDQDKGIRAEYDRMLERFRNGDFRRFLQCAQVWTFSNGRENDPDLLLPAEGAFYAASAEGDFPLRAFRERHPGIRRKLQPRKPEEERRILEDHRIFTRTEKRIIRQHLSPDTVTHCMLTGLFLPERFLFLIRYGVGYERNEDEKGSPVPEKRLLSPEQLSALMDLREKERRGYRNWTIPSFGAAGDMTLRVSLIRLLRDMMPERQLFCFFPSRREMLSVREALLESGAAGGEILKQEYVYNPEKETRMNLQKRRNPVFLIFGDVAAESFRKKLRAAEPDAVTVLWKENTVPEKGSYLYLLECSDGTLYCGWTNDLARRVKSHNQGKGARYTRSRRPVKLVYYEKYNSKEEAMSREWHVKRMTRKQKEELIRKRRT